MNTETLEVKQKNGHKLNEFTIQDIGDDHMYTGIETPMKSDAFKLSDTEKKQRIALLFEEIMDVMGLDLTDDSLKGTPERVAKMYIDEINHFLQCVKLRKPTINPIQDGIRTLEISLCIKKKNSF